jgi:hypothetical protein
MIEVSNIEAIHKGSLLAKCDVRIVPWKLTLNEVKIFEHGANRSVAMPSQQYETREGETKYKELMSFDTDDLKKRFRAQVLKAVELYLAQNPDMEPEPVVTEDAEAPF